VRLLPDTQLLLWSALKAARVPPAAAALMNDLENELFFSAASIWEIAIKASHGRDDFTVDPRRLRDGLARNGYTEISVTSDHAAFAATLPLLHKDPFDRMLVAQATSEGITLLTADFIVASYPGPIRKV
jgi:PIN domain nuclease of toxin-antitoxin system